MSSTLERYAYHEAGHVVFALARGRQVYRAEIADTAAGVEVVPGGMRVGGTTYYEQTFGRDDQLALTLAGQLAASIHCGAPMDGSSLSDEQEIAAILSDLSWHCRGPARARAGNHAAAVLRDHKPKVEAIAKALLVAPVADGKRSLSAVELSDLWSGKASPARQPARPSRTPAGRSGTRQEAPAERRRLLVEAERLKLAAKTAKSSERAQFRKWHAETLAELADLSGGAP